MTTNTNWITVCNVDDLVDNSGVCAILDDHQVAIFKINSANDDTLAAVSNWDPIGKANVLYRGLIGSVEDKAVVASPLYKQRYCLTTGECLDDQDVRLTVYRSRIFQQQVQLQLAG